MAKQVVPDIIWVPSGVEEIAQCLSMANAGPADIFLDIGCGDGVTIETAVNRFNVKKAIGIDIDPQRIQEARKRLRPMDAARYKLLRGDFVREPARLAKLLRKVTVVYLYLYYDLAAFLGPYLLTYLPDNARVVCSDYFIRNLSADKQATADGRVYFDEASVSNEDCDYFLYELGPMKERRKRYGKDAMKIRKLKPES